jgi:pimeloyl-ACP methyl ester carboxylesterase
LTKTATTPRPSRLPRIARRTGRTTRQRLRRVLSRSALKLFEAAARDALRAVRRQPPYLARVVGQPGEAAVFTDPQVAEVFTELGGEAAGWRNAFAPRFVFGLPQYRAGTAERLRMPLLVCVADDDLEVSPEFAAWVAMRAPRGEVRRYPVGHFDVYVEPLRSRVIADQIAFLRRNLRVPGP